MASASTPSVHEPANAIFVHTVELKPIIKAQISGKLVISALSDVVTISVYLKKTSLKKLMKIIIITRRVLHPYITASRTIINIVLS